MEDDDEEGASDLFDGDDEDTYEGIGDIVGLLDGQTMEGVDEEGASDSLDFDEEEGHSVSICRFDCTLNDGSEVLLILDVYDFEQYNITMLNFDYPGILKMLSQHEPH